ncbi:interleukin-23 receptor [Entelurus aequoreus]|uniref:interleukin-23 receptor n=1 Tax=Entelurus aequoreus TaxID=161455 RepID=UPI002B1CF176|nr:interleukin-23 receptor [Entelurus aequoreus]
MTFWRVTMALLLGLLLTRRDLLLGSCQTFDHSLGAVSVEPSQRFELGSDLTVFCHISACKQRYQISLELNSQPVALWKREKCSPAIFRLSKVTLPRFSLLCLLKRDNPLPRVVGGVDLIGGRPPDKPLNLTCVTTRRWEQVECSWRRGRDTHVATSCNVSFSRENSSTQHLGCSPDQQHLILPPTLLAGNTSNQLIVTAHNEFGRVQSDPFVFTLHDIVVPQSPVIQHIHFKKNSSRLAAILRWNTSERVQHLQASVRRRRTDASWDVSQVTRLDGDEVQVDGLEPLVDYEFQMMLCDSAPYVDAGQRSRCSKWSPSMTMRSPGKGPSKPLSVWRVLTNQQSGSLRKVTLLWKAPPPDDYSGQVECYRISLGQDSKQEVRCNASLTQCDLQVHHDISALSLSVNTTFGTSPPAHLPLTLSGDSSPPLRLMGPALNSSKVLVSWAGPELGSELKPELGSELGSELKPELGSELGSELKPELGSELGSELKPELGSELGSELKPEGADVKFYVVEWTSVPEDKMHWQEVTADEKHLIVTGLMAGVRYNISLYAVSSRGVSTPTSILVYSKQLKPVSGPLVSVVVHKKGRIHIQWEDPAVEQQRGFFTNYNIYLHTPQSLPSVTMSAPRSRETWLDCPDGIVFVQMSASTSAGEGQRGNLISSQPVGPAAGLSVLVFMVVVFSAVVVQVICWCCVRPRIKEECPSWAPDWLSGKLPKAENSRVIKLLQLDQSELSFSSLDKDPPLSPISCVSQDDLYPCVHDDQPTAMATMADDRPAAMATMANGYAPQLMATMADGYAPQLMAASASAGRTTTTTTTTTTTNTTTTTTEASSGWKTPEEDQCPSDSALLANFLSCADSDPHMSPSSGHLSTQAMLARRDPERITDRGPAPLDPHQGDLSTLLVCATSCSLHGCYLPQTQTHNFTN